MAILIVTKHTLTPYTELHPFQSKTWQKNISSRPFEMTKMWELHGSQGEPQTRQQALQQIKPTSRVPKESKERRICQPYCMKAAGQMLQKLNCMTLCHIRHNQHIDTHSKENGPPVHLEKQKYRMGISSFWMIFKGCPQIRVLAVVKRGDYPC